MVIARKRAEQTVKAVVDHFYDRYRKDEAWTKRYDSGDVGCLEELVALACSKTGVSMDDYADTFDAYPELQQLQTRLMTDRLLEPLQPGPNNPKYCESAGARIEQKRAWWKFW